MFAESIMSFTSESLAGALSYIPEVFTDVKYLVLVVMGLPIAFWFIGKTISLVRAR